MRTILASLAVILALSAPAMAQKPFQQQVLSYEASRATLWGGAAFDFGTTIAAQRYGKFKEANPLLGQNHGVQAGVIFGHTLLTDVMTHKLIRSRKNAAIANFIVGGLHISAGIWNSTRARR